jgi:DNA repair exonuclease SbcCD ATPase subunit
VVEVIECLILRGFQAHDKLVLNPDPGVTTIIGPSDSGKSSIIRALRWLALNQPSGDSFIRWGAKRAKVKLLVDGQTVVRERGPENLYSLDARDFKSFGNDVPGPISSLLGMGEINFQGQYDGPFWLSNTAGEVSRHLNGIVGLEIIDRVLSELRSRIRKESTNVELIEGRLAEAKEDCRKWKFAEKLDKDLKSIESTEKRLEEAKTSCDGLGGFISDVAVVRVELDLVTFFRTVITALVELWESYEKLRAERDDLARVVGDAEAQKLLISRGASIPDPGSVDAVLEVDMRVGGLRIVIRDCEQAVWEQAGARSMYEELQTRFKRDLGKDCPLCGQQIKS